MTEMELLKVIGYAQDVHILDAEEPIKKRKVISFPKPLIRTIAAILTVVLAVGLFLKTPMGVAVAEAAKDQFGWFLDLLFPPKDEVVYVEGFPETIHVQAKGREPEEKQPGFSIYVDTESYAMTEENGSWFVRPIAANPELPPIEMQITEVLDKHPLEAAEETRAQMEGNWEALSNIRTYWLDNKAEVLAITASKGMQWDSAQEDHQFIDNLRGGSYHVVIRYFMEASEGAGVRLHNMLKSFTIIAPQDISQYQNETDTLVQAMEQEIAYAEEQDSWQSDAIDPEIAAMERNARWLDTHRKLWEILERSADEETLQNLLSEQLSWGARKRIAINLLNAEDRAVREEENAKWIKERCYMLLHYLDGSAGLAPRAPGMNLDPKPMVEEIAEAYFSGDHETIEKYLSDSYWGVVEIHTTGTEVVNAFKGMDNIPQDMANYGRLNASVEFRPTADSDYFQYLSITLIWENGHWAVASYGLEG